MKKEIFIAVFATLLLVISFAVAETETPTGTFDVANVAPPQPTSWTPGTTHSKVQAFSWTEGTDDNGDPISTYICITNNTDTDSCSVVNSGLTADPSYTFTQAESNWDYAPFMTSSRNYYVKLTPNDGTENGTVNDGMSFTLTDAVPAFTVTASPTGGSICDIDWDELGSLTFSGTTADADNDNTTFRVCSTNSFGTTTDSCVDTTSCSTSQNATASKFCTNSGLSDPATGAAQTAYAFTCDCVNNDDSCPSQCNTTGQTVTYYVNQQPADVADANVTGGNADTDLSCTGTTASYGTGDTGNAGTGHTNFNWAGGAGNNCGGSATASCAEANFHACQILTCYTEAEDDCARTSPSTDSAAFQIANTVPSMSAWTIQNGASNFADMSINASATHDNTPVFRITISDIDLEDDNTQQVTVRINLSASTPGAVDAGGPYTTTVTSSGTVDVSATTELAYNGTSKTYYASVEVYDNATCGTNEGTVHHLIFALTNNLPYINTLNTSTTHDNTPTVSWTITDADDGTDGKWPADDTWNSHVWAIDTDNSSIYCSYTGTTINNSQTLCQLPWSTPDDDMYANRTLDFVVFVEDKFSANAGYHEQAADSVNTTKQFVLYDYLPDVTDIEMTDVGSAYSSCTAASCALNPIEHSNASIAVKLTATDTDEDCDTTSVAYIHLCRVSGASACDEVNNNHYSWQVDSILRSGSTCTYEFSANKTASDNTVEFFRLPGEYKLHVNISGQGGERTADSERDSNWTYGTLKAIDYPSTVTLGDGSPTLGQWNNGTSLATMSNWGNDVLNMQWQATDPTSGGDTWVLNGTDIQIDDDTGRATEAGPIAPVYVNGTARTFEPASGLQVCTSHNCNDAALNDTLATYFHIAPPLGLLAGTYNSTLTVTIS